MKKRHPAAVLLLPIVTLGIYCIYWFYATRKELVARNKDEKSIPPVLVLFLPLIGLGLLVLLALMGGHGEATPTAISVILITLGIAGVLAALVVPLWWTWRYCKVLTPITKGLDFTQLYVLYVVLAGVCNLLIVWMLLVQLDINKLIDREAAAPSAKS
jgi:hypothetical protein